MLIRLNLSTWNIEFVAALFIVGLLVLLAGGHFLVHGSSRIARILGIHPIVVGLTIVALGTSMPEFVVSLLAALKNKTDVALGNVVGSNISNMALILGLAATVRPIIIKRRILKFEMPLVLGVSLLFWLLCSNGYLSRIDGIILTFGFFVYLFVVLKNSRQKTPTMNGDFFEKRSLRSHLFVYAFYILIGIGGLTLGAAWIVDSASEFSFRYGVPELILGLTIVAIGTSLPELATSLVAAVRNEGDLSIGNILGSNIFNMLAIAGPTATIHPLAVTPELVTIHLPIMTALTLLLFPLLRTGFNLSRLEGFFLLLCYVGIFFVWAFYGKEVVN